MSTEDSIDGLQQQPIDETKPGLGQYYCIPCAKYFETQTAKSHHQRGKVHKRRVKLLKEGPYTQEEANAAAGHDVAKYMTKKDERKTLSDGQLQQKVLAEVVADEVATTEDSTTTTTTEEVAKEDAMQVEEA